MRLLTSATLTSERKRVDDVVGLAAPERQPDQQIGSDIADDILRDRLGVGSPDAIGTASAQNRTQPSAAIAYLHLRFVCDEPATAKH